MLGGSVGAGVGAGSATGATSTLGTDCSGGVSTSGGSPSNGAVHFVRITLNSSMEIVISINVSNQLIIENT